MTHAAAGDEEAERTWCLAEVDIFCDLSEREMEAIATAAPMKTYHAGEILYAPTQPSEVLFILKKGRIRVFRVSADGRALTTAIVSPGTIFGEMVLLGQHMYDNYAEALDDTVVCVMSRADVHRLLLADPRVAARIAAILGRRPADLEQRLSDTVFKTVAQRIATTLTTLTSAQAPAGPLRPVGRHPQIARTHENLPPSPAPPAKPAPRSCANTPNTACSAWLEGASPSSTPSGSRTPPADVTHP